MAGFCDLKSATLEYDRLQQLLNDIILKGDLHGTTLSHATSLRQAYDTNCFV